MSLSSTIIGRLGQKALELWAAQVSATANPSLHDERGWDVFLQLPLDAAHADSGPLDRLPPEVSCMVQVKTTTTSDTSEPINLLNWRRMCTEPMPWFVLAVKIDDQTQEVKDAHLVHVDEFWCSKVLKRLREIGPEARDTLHKHDMNISWSDEHHFDELHGRELQRHVRLHVAPGQREYIAKKLKWFDELGYTDRAKRITISLGDVDRDTTLEQIADLGIGLRSTFPPGWRARVSDVRFGIEASLSSFGPEAGEIKYHAPSLGRMRLELRSSHSKRHASFNCEAYRACAVFPFIPIRHDKTRLVSDDISVVIAPLAFEGRHGFSTDFTFAIPRGLLTVAALRAKVTMAQILLNNEQDPMILRLSAGEEASEFTPDHTSTGSAELRKDITTLDDALAICAAFDVPDTTLVAPEDLEKQGPSIHFLARVLEEQKQGRLVAPYDKPVQLGETFGATAEAALFLNDRALALIVGTYGIVSECKEYGGLGFGVQVNDGTLINRKLTIPENTPNPDSLLNTARADMQNELTLLGCTAISDSALQSKLRTAKATPT